MKPDQLVRIDPVTGLTLSEIASTTTSKGRFSFDLTQLGVGLSNTLLVQLAEETGVKLRAFAVDNVLNWSLFQKLWSKRCWRKSRRIRRGI